MIPNGPLHVSLSSSMFLFSKTCLLDHCTDNETRILNSVDESYIELRCICKEYGRSYLPRPQPADDRLATQSERPLILNSDMIGTHEVRFSSKVR